MTLRNAVPPTVIDGTDRPPLNGTLLHFAHAS